MSNRTVNIGWMKIKNSASYIFPYTKKRHEDALSFGQAGQRSGLAWPAKEKKFKLLKFLLKPMETLLSLPTADRHLTLNLALKKTVSSSSG